MSLSSETTAVLLAAALKVTVQVVEAMLPNVAGVQPTEVSCAGALPVAVKEKVRDTLFRVAVNIAVWLETTAATVAVKVALLSPAPMLMLLGTVTLVLVLCSATVTALAVAAVRVTEQREVPGELTVPGAHVRLLSWVTAVKLTVACWLWPLRVAVTMALWLPLTTPEVAVKVALLWPSPTTTLAGTVSNPLLLASATVTALLTALFIVTVQAVDALLPSVAGAQATEISCAGALAVTVKVCETLFSVAVSRAV